MSVTVRRAEARDIEFVGQDGYLRTDLVRQKVEHGEVFLAEIDGLRVAFV